jgi:hypothetical protein
MVDAVRRWERGRGKLGLLDPLIGVWQTEADTQIGYVQVIRKFAWILDRTAVQLDASWSLPGGNSYSELAIFATDGASGICFWSFTSDGKNSRGKLVDGSDVHIEAISFEAQMPAGLARTSYWPSDNGFDWAVESKTANGWNRFMEHSFRRFG